MSVAVTADLPQIDSPAELTGGPVRFHLSLNVADLGRSIEFFRAFFGIEPAKRRSDYAKFELDEPPLVLSLEPFAAPPGGNLNHLGFRMPSAALLVECQRRLEMAGIATQREEGVECCYARQTKFWVHDPDHNLWEVYTFDGDIEHRGAGQVPEVVASGRRAPTDMYESPTGATPSGSLRSPLASEEPAPLSIWKHRLGQPIPERLPILDATVDRVELQGSLNMTAADDQTNARLFDEILRVLKPGGSVELHCLTADRSLAAGRLALPGPAAMVERVPIDRVVVHALERAGLVNIRFTKLGESPCFTALGAELRETKIEANKFGSNAASEPGLIALYKGPFRELTDDEGRIFRRGERVAIDRATWQRLQSSASQNFLLIER